MSIKIICASLFLFALTAANAQTDSTVMQRTKSQRTYQQTDSTNIRYQAPVDQTVQDTATHYHGGTTVKDKKVYNKEVKSTSTSDSSGYKSRPSTTGGAVNKKEVKSRTSYEKKNATGSDSTKKMYLIKTDSTRIERK